MFRISKHLNALLATHDCIIIPSFGAIIKERIYPYLDQEKKFFYPGTTVCHFNPDLKIKDGFLEASYAKTYGVSLRRASIMLKDDIEILKNTLLDEGRFNFENIGSFELKDNGVLEFFPEDYSQNSFSQGDFYGFSPISTLERVAVASNTNRVDSNYIHIRIHKKAARLVALFLVLFVSIYPITTSSRKDYFSASVLPMLHTEEVKKEVSIKENNQTIVEIKNLEENKKEELLGDFYIVIGAFRSMEKATVFISSCKNESFYSSLGTLYKNNRNMIYSYRFKSVKEAKNKLLALRKNKNFHQNAWILHYKENK